MLLLKHGKISTDPTDWLISQLPVEGWLLLWFLNLCCGMEGGRTSLLLSGDTWWNLHSATCVDLCCAALSNPGGLITCDFTVNFAVSVKSLLPPRRRGIIESWGWKGPTRSSSPIIQVNPVVSVLYGFHLPYLGCRLSYSLSVSF